MGWLLFDAEPGFSRSGQFEWATRQGIDDVIWTALGPKFDDQDGRVPTVDQAVAYLRKLSDEGKAANAKEYVREAPVDTVYRRRIVHALGWAPDD